MSQPDIRQMLDLFEKIETNSETVTEAPVRPVVKPSERIAQRQQAAAGKTGVDPTVDPSAPTGTPRVTTAPETPSHSPIVPAEPKPTVGTEGPAAPQTGNIHPEAPPAQVTPQSKGNIFKDPNAFKGAWEGYLKNKGGNYRLIADPDMLGLLKQLWRHSGGVEAKESKINQKKILESIIPEYHSVYMEWYNMGRMLNEAAITQKQIQDIFSALEAGAKAGLNVDAPGTKTPSGNAPKRGILGSISQGYSNLKDKISQSTPISGFDVKFDKLQQQLLDKVGGSGGTVGKMLKAYKVFGQKYPKVQSALYYGLTIALAVSGWGLGATAVMAALRTLNGLLQGERFSSAAWKGVKTMVLGTAAAEIFGSMGGGSDAAAGDVVASGDPYGWTEYAVKSGDTLSQIAQDNGVSVKELLDANPDITNPDVLKVGQEIKIPEPTGSAVYQSGVGTAADTMKGIETGKYADSPISRKLAARAGLNEMIDYKRMQRTYNLQESLKLPLLSAVYLTPVGANAIVEQINEGLWDTIKQKFTSPQITRDKLDLFWRKNYGEYSTADSVDTNTFIDFLHRMGIKDALISKVFGDLKIPMDDVAPTDVPKDVTSDALDWSKIETWKSEFDKFAKGDGTISIPVKSMIGDVLKTALGTVRESKLKTKK